jgi:hypothetical protein
MRWLLSHRRLPHPRGVKLTFYDVDAKSGGSLRRIEATWNEMGGKSQSRPRSRPPLGSSNQRMPTLEELQTTAYDSHVRAGEQLEREWCECVSQALRDAARAGKHSAIVWTGKSSDTSTQMQWLLSHERLPHPRGVVLTFLAVGSGSNSDSFGRVEAVWGKASRRLETEITVQRVCILPRCLVRIIAAYAVPDVCRNASNTHHQCSAYCAQQF